MAKNNSIIGILINIQKAGNGDKEAIASLKGLQKGIGDITTIFGTLAAAAFAIDRALDATAGEFLKYADNVRGMQQAFSMTSEEASRLIQISDDLGISQETLTKALKSMSSEGVAPSLAGLQQLADRFKLIEDPAERAKFLTDNFGKSGLEMAAAMRLGSQGLQDMNDSVQQNLVLSQQAVDEARDYQMQVDALNDSWAGFKMQVGQGVVPALNDLLIHMQAQSNINKQFAEEGKVINTWSQEYQDALKAETEALIAKQQAQIEAENGMNALTEATENAVAASERFLSEQDILDAALRGTGTQALKEYGERSAALGTKTEELQKQIETLTEQGVEKNREEIEKLKMELIQTAQEQEDLANATDQAIAAMIRQTMFAKMDTAAQIKMGHALGLLSDKEMVFYEALDKTNEQFDVNKDGMISGSEATDEYVTAVENLKNAFMYWPDAVFTTVYVSYVENGTPPPTDGAPPGGGGGSGECFLAGTLVDTPNGPRAIETLHVGDDVYSMQSERGERIVTRVARTYHHPAENNHGYLVINKFLKVTPNHPIYTSRGYREAGALVMGEPIRAWNGWVFVHSIESVLTPVETYNIETEDETHNYFADGILVHNKDSQGYASGGVARGPSTGHYELLHGTEVITTQSQFNDIMRAFSNMANAPAAGAGGASFAGATININMSGRESFGEFMQELNRQVGRRQ